MKITPYGSLVGLGVVIFYSLMPKVDIKLYLVLILSIIIQRGLCSDCDRTYTLASYLSVFPLLLVLLINNCEYLKELLFAIMIGLSVSRIGCYFAGCCTGKECPPGYPLGILYKKGSVVVDKYLKRDVKVYPTIILEIISQFLIALAVLKSDYGIILFGLLNSLLIFFTNLFRQTPRMGMDKYIPIKSLLLFSLISYFKCGEIKSGNVKLFFKPYSIIIGLIFALVISNDINFA